MIDDDRDLLASTLAHPFPPTPGGVAPCPLSGAASPGSVPSGDALARTVRLVAHLLAHPLTTSAARVGAVGLTLASLGWWGARVVLP